MMMTMTMVAKTIRAMTDAVGGVSKTCLRSSAVLKIYGVAIDTREEGLEMNMYN